MSTPPGGAAPWIRLARLTVSPTATKSLTGTLVERAHHDDAGVDAHPHRERDAVLQLELGVELLERLPSCPARRGWHSAGRPRRDW